MIFHIDNSIMGQGKDIVLNFAKALQTAADNQHCVELTPQVWNWTEKTILQADDYLGKIVREQLTQNTELWKPTSMMRTYETSVTIGYGKDMLTVDDMAFLAKEASNLVLENGRYDGIAVKRWVQLYRKEKTAGNINKDVHKAISEGRIRIYNSGGGNGSILNAVRTLMETTRHLSPYRLTTLFDSDKNAANDKDHNQNLKDSLKRLQIEWHELEKREIENYFPPETYKKAGFMTNENRAMTMSKEEWDFHDTGHSDVVKIEKKNIKDLCDHLTKEDLKKRVEESSGTDEIQRFIFHLAKFI